MPIKAEAQQSAKTSKSAKRKKKKNKKNYKLTMDAGGQRRVETATEQGQVGTDEKLKERKVSWARLRRVDSLNLEAGRVSMSSHAHSSQVLPINL